METHVIVNAKCTLTGLYLPSLEVLELTCECPKGMAGDIVHLLEDSSLKIKYNNTVSGSTGSVFDLRNKENVENIAEEVEPDNRKGRSKLIVRLKNYAADLPDNLELFCLVRGFNKHKQLDSERVPLRMLNGIPTTTTTTTTTKTAAPGGNIMTLPSQPPYRGEITPFAATGETEKDSFKAVGLYVVVAVSCVMVVTIVIVIICFVRVRERRKLKKLDLEKDLELEERWPGKARNCRQLDDSTHSFLCQSNENCLTLSHSPARGKMIGQDHACVVHKPCRPVCQHETEASIQGERGGGRGNKEAPPADTLPLFGPRGHQGRDQRQPRRSATSEDDEDCYGRRERLLKDNPQRPRPRDVPSRTPREGHSRSVGVDAHPENYYPHAADPRQIRADRHYPNQIQARPPTTAPGYRNFYDDGRLPQVSMRGFRGRYVSEGAAPLTVRVEEDNNVVYEDVYSSSTIAGEEGDMSGTTSGGEATLEGGPFPGQDLQVGGVMMDTRSVTESCGSRPLQQPRRTPRDDRPGRYPTTDTIPPSSSSSRRYRHPSSTIIPTPTTAPPPPPPHHYNTTPTRHRSPARSTRPLHHNLSYPHLHHQSDGETARGVRYPLHSASDAEELQPAQYSAHRSGPTRRQHNTGNSRDHRRRSRSVGNIQSEDPHQDPRHRERSVGNIRSEDPRQDPRYKDRARMSPQRSADPQGLRELSQLPSPGGRGGEEGSQLNVLSRNNTRPPPPSPAQAALNVPVGRVPPPRDTSASGHHQDSTRRKRLAAEVTLRTSGAETEEWQSRVGRRDRRSRVAQTSDSSPNTTPSQHRRSFSSSSDNDSPRPSTSRGRRQRSEREPEINVRDIKTDNETRRKRLVSLKVRNNNNNNNGAHAPVVCAADVAAQNQRGAATAYAAPTHRGLRRKESARSGGASHGSRAGLREEVRPARLAEQFGVDIVASLDDSSQLSHYTQDNHVTNAKVPHPRPE
ncbi:hypothetical protein ACOMHN_023776 [Nucella lapillus]